MKLKRRALLSCLLSLQVAVFAQKPDSAEPPVWEDIDEVTLTEMELEESDAMVGSISGILSSSRDLYQNTASYQFGNARYRIKGFTSDQSNVTINGVPMEDPSTGRSSYSLWGGLNDVTRYPSVVSGIGFSEHSYGNVGGLVNYSMMASDMRKGFRATYSYGNRSYTHRAMVTYNSGLLPSGWAFSLSGSRRYADEGYIEGCGYDAWAYFASIEKRIGDRHRLNIVAFGSPRENGRASATTQEAYDLAGSHFYNPNWGYQNGKKRNSSIAKSNQPVFILTHKWDISEKAELTTSASYIFGRYGTSSISWVSGDDPRPDYYKNLPSYYTNTKINEEEYESAKLDWETNVNRRQIDWDKFYLANQNRIDVIHNANNTGETVTGHRANYYVQERRNDRKQFNLTSIYNYSFDKMSWNAGINATLFKGHNFATIVDLLGADFYLDVDKYVMRDSIATNGERFPESAHSDVNNPNKICRVGDKCGYNYISNLNKIEAFGQIVYSWPKLELMGGAKIQRTTLWRNGLWRNGIHADNSYGGSWRLNFNDFSVKAGATYKLDGRNHLILNALYQTDAPTFQNSFETARTSNATIDNLTSRKVFATDLSYNIRLPKFRARASVYYSMNMDDISVRNIYIEGRDEQTSNGGVYGSYIWRDLDRTHYGCELGMELDLPFSLSYSFAGGIGSFKYANDPTIQIISDDGGTNSTDKGYMKNYRIGGFPQSALATGLRFNQNYWNIGFTFSYFADIYVDIFPERRTDFALEGYTTDHANYHKIIDQQKMSNQYILDVFLGKSWKINDYYIGLNINVNNILNNKDFAYSGFEQYRLDRTKPDRFQSKFTYMYGTQAFVNLNFRF